MAQVMPQLFKDEAQEDKGATARLQNFVGAIALGDLIKTTLGPRGMDKILQPMSSEGPPSKPTITNDGATILKSLWLDNPAAKILADMSMHQDSHSGDGTTGVVVLAAELLRNAEILVQNGLHPQVICSGFRRALQCALKVLESLAFSNQNDTKALREDFFRIAKTTLSSKLLTYEKDKFAHLAVEAVMRLKSDFSLDLIQIIKKPGGSLQESYLEEGFILQKRIGVGQPTHLKNVRIMVANTPMDTDKIKIYGARVNTDSFETVQAIENAEREKMKEKVDRILAHNCNVFINRQLIYNYPDQLFKKAGVMAIEHSDFDGMERLAKALGADIVSTFENPGSCNLGFCEEIEEIIIGEDKVIRFKGCLKNEACTIVLRGSNQNVIDEAERSLHDALAVLTQARQHDPRVVLGGGAIEMAMAKAVAEESRKIPGKESLAVEAFAKALEQVPSIILDNGGFDSTEVVCRLRAEHASQNVNAGIDIEKGDVGDMKLLGVFESYRSKYQQLAFAIEAAEMIIRVDNIIRCAPRERSGM